MDTVTLDGKTYVRAVRAAGELGYAPDYVGQLCRGGKVDAKRLGKTWYVREGALEEHKRSKPRNNAGLAARNFKQQREEIVQASASGHQRATPSFVSPLLSSVRYTHEDFEPIPTLKQIAQQHEAAAAPDLASVRVSTAPEPSFEPAAEEEAYAEEPEADESPVPELVAEEVSAVTLRRVHTPKQSERRRLLERTLMDHAARAQPQQGQRAARPVRRPVAPMARRRGEGSIMVRPSLLPALAALLLAFVAANTFLTHTWHYAQGQGVQDAPTFSTSYGVTSLASVSEALQEGF